MRPPNISFSDELMLDEDIKLLFERPICISCGPGWNPLIKDILHKIASIVKTERLSDPEFYCCVSDIKEKYGALNIYISGGTDEMDELLDVAYNDSLSICEICGKPGMVNTPWEHWLSVKCDECRGYSNDYARTTSRMILALNRIKLIDWSQYRSFMRGLVQKLHNPTTREDA